MLLRFIKNKLNERNRIEAEYVSLCSTNDLKIYVNIIENRKWHERHYRDKVRLEIVKKELMSRDYT